MRRLLVQQTLLAGLVAFAALPLPGIAVAQAAKPFIPAVRLLPDDPGARFDPKLLMWPAIRAPQIRSPRRRLPLGAATREVTHSLVTGETIVSAAPAERLYGSTEVGRRYQARESLPYCPEPEVSVQKVIGRDERVRLDSAYPYSALCKLFITFPDGTPAIGSGTLIGPKHVLTAGHCAWSAKNGGWAKSIEVVPGLRGSTKPFGSAMSKLLRTYQSYQETGDPNHDFALITLDQEIGKNAGWFGFAFWPQVVGFTANIVGYPRDRDNGVYQYFHSGPIDNADQYQVYYRIDTYGGQSGSGVFSIKDDGLRYVLAVHTWGNILTNGGTRIDSAKFDSIRAWIAQDR